MTTVTRSYRFSASHRLHCRYLSDAENTRLYGKCNNPFGHGHDYTLEVTVSGPVDAVTGRIVPLASLDRLIESEVLQILAFRNLNLDVPYFADTVPTTENLTLAITTLLQRNWALYIPDAAVRLARVHLQETGRNGFELPIAASPNGELTSQSETVTVHG